MKLKKIIFVIIISILVGFGIFNYTKSPKQMDPVLSQKLQTNPSPSPTPTIPPIDQNTNLEEEIKTLKAPDFSEDFKKLKDQLN